MAVGHRVCFVAGFLFILLLPGCEARIHKLTLTVRQQIMTALARELIACCFPLLPSSVLLLNSYVVINSNGRGQSKHNVALGFVMGAREKLPKLLKSES